MPELMPTRPTLRMSAGPDAAGVRPTGRYTVRYSLPPFEASDHWESEVHADTFDAALAAIRGTLSPSLRDRLVVMTVEVGPQKLSSKIHPKAGSEMRHPWL